jgi:hypothetical protein
VVKRDGTEAESGIGDAKRLAVPAEDVKDGFEVVGGLCSKRRALHASPGKQPTLHYEAPQGTRMARSGLIAGRVVFSCLSPEGVVAVNPCG